MRKFLAVLIYAILIVVPTGIMFYFISTGITRLFGKEVFMLILTAFGVIIVFQRIFKKFKKLK
jgi:hypothetical protein